MKTQHSITSKFRVVLLAAVIAGLALASGPASLTHPPATQAQGETPHAAGNDWYTYASGDDVLALEAEGPILWAGTRGGGLVRWNTADGTYVQYLKPQDPLAGNTVRDVYVDADGNKWLATDDGLSVFNDQGTAAKADDVWYSYATWSIGRELPSNTITAVAMDEAGFLWLGTNQYWDAETEAYAGGGLVKIDTHGTLLPADDEWLQTYTVANTQPTDSEDQILGLASDNVTDILPVSGNRVWIATQKYWALREFDEGGGEPSRRWLQVSGGLSRLDHAGTPATDDDTWHTWTCAAGPQYNADVSCTINELKSDANGFVWGAQRGRGLIAFPQDAAGDLGAIRFGRSEGLEANSVAAIVFGSGADTSLQNTVWVAAYDAATGRGGISELNHGGTVQNQTDDVWNEHTPVAGERITQADGLSGDRVQAMVISGGKLWLGSGGAYGKAYGISAFDPQQQTFGARLSTAGSNLPYNYVTDLAVGEAGTRWENQVWVATGSAQDRHYGAGALLLQTGDVLNPAANVWTRFTKTNTDDDGLAPWTGLASDDVTAVAVDGDHVWFGAQPATWDEERRTWTDGGLSVYDGERWTIRTVENTGGPEAGLRSNAISALAIGCFGELWIGQGKQWTDAGVGHGIEILDPQGALHDPSNDWWWDPIRYPTIPSDLVTDIAPDCERNQIWISTSAFHGCFGATNFCRTLGGGVARYDYVTGEWTSWTAEDGLESYAQDNVTGSMYAIDVGPDGTVWAGGLGTLDTSRQALVDEWPNLPATINWFRDGEWSSQVFESDGRIASTAVDENRTVWAGTSRGGMDVDKDGLEDEAGPDQALGGVKHTVAGTDWGAWTPDNSPLATNDVEVIEVGPNGDVWVGTQGWGLMRFGAPLPIFRFDTTKLHVEVTAPSAVGLDESPAVDVTVYNESEEAVFYDPTVRLRIRQDQAAPILGAPTPAAVSGLGSIQPGASVSVTFALHPVRRGTATVDVDVLGEVGSTQEPARDPFNLSANPVSVEVGEAGQNQNNVYLPLILSQEN